MLVKDAKRKVLPELTDEWVAEVSEFDTIDALRADTAARLELYAKVQTQMLVRDKVLEAPRRARRRRRARAARAQEMERRLHDLHHRLEPQGATIPSTSPRPDRTRRTFVANVRAGRPRAVKADLALRAVVAQEGIEATRRRAGRRDRAAGRAAAARSPRRCGAISNSGAHGGSTL